MYTEGTMPLFKTTSTWTGAAGLPGYTNLWFKDTGVTSIEVLLPNIADAVATFWDDVHGALPNTVTVTTSPEVAQINEATGNLETLWAISPSPTAVVGAGGALGPAPAGACISWNTGEVWFGRVVRGRTFLVPLALSSYQSDGTLVDSVVTVLNDAALNLIGNPDVSFVIYSRPVTGDNAHGGTAYPAAIGQTRDKVAVLRSRRD